MKPSSPPPTPPRSARLVHARVRRVRVPCAARPPRHVVATPPCNRSGLEEAVHLAFVVAAGKADRPIGASAPPLGLPSDVCSGESILELYCAHIQARCCRECMHVTAM